MQRGRSSGTASVAAVSRAAHPIVDGPPYVFNDDMAAALGGMNDDNDVLAALSNLRQQLAATADPEVVDTWMRYSRLSVAARARYTEEQLVLAIARGVKQYVMLGAGLDSFAYRRRDLSNLVRVYELDYPATQESKLCRLQELGINIPSNLTFVPIDFEDRSISEALQGTSFCADEPAFFSWLGVIFYLSDKAMDRTLAEIGSFPSGSEIVFDYFLPKERVSEEGRQVLSLIEALTADRGEPGGHYFEPATLEARLKRLGFSQVWHFGANEVDAHYLAQRTDGLQAGTSHQLIRARVLRLEKSVSDVPEPQVTTSTDTRA
jgi:methyltransferase (TIGR00027 family)